MCILETARDIETKLSLIYINYVTLFGTLCFVLKNLFPMAVHYAPYLTAIGPTNIEAKAFACIMSRSVALAII